MRKEVFSLKVSNLTSAYYSLSIANFQFLCTAAIVTNCKARSLNQLPIPSEIRAKIISEFTLHS